VGREGAGVEAGEGRSVFGGGGRGEVRGGGGYTRQGAAKKKGREKTKLLDFFNACTHLCGVCASLSLSCAKAVHTGEQKRGPPRFFFLFRVGASQSSGARLPPHSLLSGATVPPTRARHTPCCAPLSHAPLPCPPGLWGLAAAGVKFARPSQCARPTCGAPAAPFCRLLCWLWPP
jgi:hypothetical protein